MAAGLQSEIWNNNIRSVLLLALYPVLIGALIWGIAYVIGASQQAAAPEIFANHLLIEFWPSILTVIALWFAISFFWNTSMIRALSHAKSVSRAEEPEIYNLLENLCISRGLKTPRINIIESEALNAFASGVSDSTYTITVTRGLMRALQRDEMEAVLGHELTHIINRDVRLMMVAVVFTGMIGFAAQLVWSNLRYGFYAPRDRRQGGSGSGVVLMLAVAAILWVGYMATLLTRFAISRRREFMADAGSVELTKNPDAMMRALMRIAGKDRIGGVPADVSMMCCENAQPFLGLFATHPPIEARIKTIAALTQTEMPDMHRPRKNPWV